jgi:hypothetical protein
MQIAPPYCTCWFLPINDNVCARFGMSHNPKKCKYHEHNPSTNSFQQSEKQ